MCEFCTKHGDGKVWYKNAANYSKDLVSDLNRKKYINDFFEKYKLTGSPFLLVNINCNANIKDWLKLYKMYKNA